MKILLVNDYPLGTGMGNYAFELFHSLEKICNIEQIFMDYSNRELLKIHKGSKTKLANFLKFTPFNERPLLWWRLKHLIPEEFDVYHLTRQSMFPLFQFHKNVATCHDIFYFMGTKNPLQRCYRKWLYNKLKESDSIIAISNSTANDLIKLFKIPSKKINVICHGINHDIFKKRDKASARKRINLLQEDKLIMHIGNIDACNKKNIPFIIKGFSILKRRLPVKLIRISNPNRREISLAKKLGLQNDIIYLHNLDVQTLALYYNAVDLFVFPSLYEGFGFPVLEAMASGCPVIASNTSSLPEIISNCGIQVDPTNIQEFANAMYRVLTNGNLKREMSEKGIERAKMFSWGKCALETLDTYKNIG